MGAFVLAALIIMGTVILAILSEFARGMATAPSMHDSYFFQILIAGCVLAVIVALTHWLPNIGW